MTIASLQLVRHSQAKQSNTWQLWNLIGDYMYDNVLIMYIPCTCNNAVLCHNVDESVKHACIRVILLKHSLQIRILKMSHIVVM